MGAGTVNEALYVCVHVPEFPAQAMLRLRPEADRAACAVLDGVAPQEYVCSMNRLAGRLGVVQRMTRAELDTFAELHVLRRSNTEESVARGILLETAGMFTPRVEVQGESGSAFSIVLDMTGSTRIFGSAAQIIEQITQALKAVKVFAQLAASTNLHAAVSMASMARHAAYVIPAGDEARALAGLPLACLALTRHQAEALSLWGLRTLGDLAELPEVDLVVRLGQEGKRLRLLARGEHPHLMVPQEPVFALEEFLQFESPVETLDAVLYVLETMLGQVIQRAQNRALAVASVTLQLGLEGGGQHKSDVKPALPVARADVLLKLLHLDLEAHPPGAAVLSVRLCAEPGDQSEVQIGLFAPQLPESMRLDVTLARIAALVGEDRVGRARLQDNHKADSFVMERFIVTPGKAKATLMAKRSVAVRRCRPAVQIAMQRNGTRPSVFRLRGAQYAVDEAFGPWRKSGQWWSSGVWSCEEWDVRASTNAGEVLLCVIVHDLLLNCWQLEALYD